MSEQLAGRSDMSSLDSLTLALVVSGLGFYTDETAAGLRRNVESKGIAHTAKEFDASLERATRHFAQGDSHWLGLSLGHNLYLATYTKSAGSISACVDMEGKDHPRQAVHEENQPRRICADFARCGDHAS